MYVCMHSYICVVNHYVLLATSLYDYTHVTIIKYRLTSQSEDGH